VFQHVQDPFRPLTRRHQSVHGDVHVSALLEVRVRVEYSYVTHRRRQSSDVIIYRVITITLETTHPPRDSFMHASSSSHLDNTSPCTAPREACSPPSPSTVPSSIASSRTPSPSRAPSVVLSSSETKRQSRRSIFHASDHVTLKKFSAGMRIQSDDAQWVLCTYCDLPQVDV